MQQRSSGDIDIRIGLNLSVSGSPAPARKGYYNVCAKIILRGRLLRVRDGGDGVVEVVAVWGHWMGELVCSGKFPCVSTEKLRRIIKGIYYLILVA